MDVEFRGKSVLVVDDLPENIKVLSSFLSPMGFTVSSAESGEEALEKVAESPPDIILLDLMLPGLDGFEVCRHLKQNIKTRHIPVIIITGLTDRDANIRAIASGADDFLIKPFDRVLLQTRINTSLKTKVLQDELLEHQKQLESRVKDRTAQLERTQQVAVFSLAKLAESRDTETGDHLDRIRNYALILARQIMEWEEREGGVANGFASAIYQSSPLHDIGKVGIPDIILLKPGKLTPEEFSIMKTHSVIGGETLRVADLEAGGNSFLAMGRDIAYYHHERWDGNGYPEGLKEEAIPLAARIVAVADVYDALSSRRPYKEPFSHEKSRGIILEGKGSHFDPRVVDAFLAQEHQFIETKDRLQSDGHLSPLEQTMQSVLKAASEASEKG